MTPQICCDTTYTPLSGFQIPASEYTFGIVITNINVRSLAFDNTVMEYRFDQFRTGDFGNDGTEIGTTVTFTEGDLLLIRFIIGMLLLLCLYAPYNIIPHY